MIVGSGWIKLVNTRKYHYFKNDVVSLCGKWMYLGTAELDSSDLFGHRDNCKTCEKKRKSLIDKEHKNEK